MKRKLMENGAFGARSSVRTGNRKHLKAMAGLGIQCCSHLSSINAKLMRFWQLTFGGKSMEKKKENMVVDLLAVLKHPLNCSRLPWYYHYHTSRISHGL